MSQYIVMSPNYEVLRYGPNKIPNQVKDAHSMGKLAKFVIGPQDIIDLSKPPKPGNFKFEDTQYEAVDIVIYVDGKESVVLKGKV